MEYPSLEQAAGTDDDLLLASGVRVQVHLELCIDFSCAPNPVGYSKAGFKRSRITASQRMSFCTFRIRQSFRFGQVVSSQMAPSEHPIAGRKICDEVSNKRPS